MADSHDSSPFKKRQRMSLCFGCGDQIYDQYILRVSPDLEWHAACLKCTECHQFLDETCTCFVRDGKTYCKCDYLRLFGAKCAKCSELFSKEDFVMRARNKIYHVDCFKCVACSKKLLPGDEFALRDDGLFCKADHQVLEKSGLHSNVIGSDLPNLNGSSFHGRALSGPLGQSDINGNNISPNSNTNSSSSGNQLQMAANAEPMQSNRHRDSVRPQVHKQSSEHKPTRVRTVLNEKQLHTLRTCYAANPRPDALMKEQLVEMTGLSPRVIRVWFQNKRCKDKKKSIMMRQMQQQEKFGFVASILTDSDSYTSQSSPDGRQLQNIATMRGVPLVATSPVRHESPVQHPIEVQTYHPPWKTLADFALQPDCDPSAPHFQHIVNQIHGYDVPPHGQLPPLGPDSGPHMLQLHGGPPTGPCTPLSYLESDLHQPPSNLSSHIPGTPSELSSPCTSE